MIAVGPRKISGLNCQCFEPSITLVAKNRGQVVLFDWKNLFRSDDAEYRAMKIRLCPEKFALMDHVAKTFTSESEPLFL